MDLIGFFYGFGVFHGLALAGVLLCARRGPRPANLCMAALLLCLSLRFLIFWLHRTDLFTQYPLWPLWFSPLHFLWGPLLYFYAYSLTQGRLRWGQLWHLMPCIVLCLAPLSLAQLPLEEQRSFLAYMWGQKENAYIAEQMPAAVPAFWHYYVEFHLHGTFFMLQFACYCFLVLALIRRNNTQLESHYSFTESQNLRWLKLMTWACIGFLLLYLLFNRIWLLLAGDVDITHPTLNVPFLFLVFCLYAMGTAAIYQSTVSAQMSSPALRMNNREMEVDGSASAGEKYAHSNLSIEDVQHYKIQLMEVMQDQQLYLDCELTLSTLAEKAGLSYHQASQVLNTELNQGFFSFVNGYRIAAARAILAEPSTPNMPVVDLAVAVGFKSKSSFYTAFKKATGTTPAHYRKQLQA